MRDREKTKEQLEIELVEYRQKLSRLKGIESELLKTKKLLKENEERYQSLIEDTLIGIMKVDLKGKITYVNKRILQGTGYSAEDMVGKNVFTSGLIPRGYTSIFRKRFKNKLRGAPPSPLEIPFKRKNGERIWLQVAGKTIWKSGLPSGVQITAENITERKKLEEYLDKERQESKLIIDSSPILIFYKDTKGRFLRVNKAHSEALKISEEQVLGKTVFDFYPKEMAENMTNDDQEVLQSGCPKINIIEQYRSATGLRWARTDKIPILNEKGTPVGLIGFAQDITDYKQADEKLKESEERYRTLFARTANPIFVIEENGNYIDGNEAALSYLECTRGELLANNVTDHIPPEKDVTAIMKQHIPLWKTGGEIETEYFVDGKSKTLKLTITPGVWDGRHVVFGIGIDITERKQVEKQLRETVQRLNAFGNALPDLAFVLDENGRYVEILTGKKNLLYKEASQITGQTLHDVLPEEVANRGLKAIRRAIETGKIQTMEYQLEVPKGLRMFEARLSPMSTDDNDPHSVAIVVRDVTQRKEAEESLRENYDYMERLTNSLSDVIFSVKLPERTIEWVNDSVEMTGYSKEECIGNTPELFFPNERDFLKFGNKLQEALAANSDILRVEQLLKKKNSELFYAEITNTFYSEKGQVDHIIGIIRDITESRRLEEEQAKVAKLESIGTLAGGIAHDFNNILTGIMGNIGLAKRRLHEGNYDYVSDRLEDAEKASLRAKDLTTQLLTFSRGGMPVKKVTSLAELLKDSAMLALRGSNVRLEFSLPDDLWSVEVDEGQINQVVNNMVINADHAMSEGGIINIKAANTNIKKKGIVPLKKGDYVKITIEDHGTGIAPEYLTKIFDPYFTTKQKGSGLGLSVAYSIIRNHEGYIAVDSKTGFGTKFTLYLPASHETAPPEKKISRGSYTTGEGRILIMDDEATIRKLLKSALTSAGYRVTQTSDGVNAIKEYIRAKESDRPFDAVILDITIPGGMGGKETVKKLLDIDKNARVIVSSGYATDPVMSDYKKYGFSAVVPKPFEISELEKTLRNVINS